MFEPTKKDKKRYEKMSLCILTPCSGYDCSIRFAQDVANMVAYSWRHGLKVHQMGITERMVVDWARNDLARRGLKTKDYDGNEFTHFLWLDDDHVFTPDLALWLAREDLDMVSALYYGRTHPHYPVVYVKDDTDDKYKHFPITHPPDSLFKCDAVGFGALLMKREVLEGTPEPWFTVDYRAGEDIAFCVKAKEHGFNIYCDSRYKLGHLGVPPIVSHMTYKKVQEENPELFEDRVRITLNG